MFLFARLRHLVASEDKPLRGFDDRGSARL
jgi:hypothetical protein